MTTTRTIRQIKLGQENDAYIRFSGSTKAVKAMVLDVQYDDKDRIASMVLDRMIHSPERDYLLSDDDNRAHVGFTGEYVSEIAINYF